MSSNLWKFFAKLVAELKLKNAISKSTAGIFFVVEKLWLTTKLFFKAF